MCLFYFYFSLSFLFLCSARNSDVAAAQHALDVAIGKSGSGIPISPIFPLCLLDIAADHPSSDLVYHCVTGWFAVSLPSPSVLPTPYLRFLPKLAHFFLSPLCPIFSSASPLWTLID